MRRHRCQSPHQMRIVNFFPGLDIYVLNEWPFIWRFSHRRMAAVVVVRKLSVNEFHKTIAKKTRGSDIRNISDK